MLLEKLKKNVLGVVAAVWSLLCALFWLAMRINWSGISKALGADKNQSFFVMETPLLICIAMWLSFAFALVALFVWGGKKKLPFFVSMGLSFVFTAMIVAVVALGACDYLSFIMPHFWRSLGVSAALALFALLLFFPAPNTKRNVILKGCSVFCAILICVICGYGIEINGFSYNAVVYAVEDDYQIVFSTTDNSIAWVEVDGENFYDLYAGSMKSGDLVHKVVVPQSVLDTAEAYTVCAQQIIYRGPFGGYKGKIISQDYNFRPVDSSDGLVYYAMTDVHGAYSGAVKTAQSVTDMDFLVMLGDNVSMVESQSDAQFAGKVASAVTKGEFPCVYVRGNHEIKGAYAEELYKYVGAKGTNFFYEFQLSDVFGIALDLGEDHDDDWWEYYGTADFVEYQNEQTAMLQKIAAQKPFDSFNYKLVCCHIPIQFINARINHLAVKTTWTSLLNDIKPDLVISGHQHDLYPFFEDTIQLNADNKLVYNSQFVGAQNKTYGGRVTDFHFNSFIVGKRGSTPTDEAGAFNTSEHIGLVTRVNLTSGEQTSSYINSRGETLFVYNPFVEGEAKQFFKTLLKTR